MNTRLRVAVSGYYGCGNIGDEAVLAGILQSFTAVLGPDATEFTILSQDPDNTTIHHKVKSVDRMSVRDLNATLTECDLLLSGGGSLLQDTTSLKSLLYYLWIVVKARRAKVPVMYYAQGMGPFRRPISKWLLRYVSKNVQMITVRDSSSVALLASLGVSGPPIHLTADPAFALRPATPERVDRQLGLAGVPTGKRLVGLALRPWKESGPDIEMFRSIARAISEQTGAHVVMLPMQTPSDIHFANTIARGPNLDVTVLDTPVSPREMLGIIGRLDGLLAMRLHALIFGAMTSVPLAALSYDPKVDELMRIVGQEKYTLPLADASEVGVLTAVNSALGDSAEIKDQLCSKTNALRESALQNVDFALLAAGRKVNG